MATDLAWLRKEGSMEMSETSCHQRVLIADLHDTLPMRSSDSQGGHHQCLCPEPASNVPATGIMNSIN